MSNQWSDNLREQMETHQEPSPEGLWEDIEQALKEEVPTKTPIRQRKILLWAKRVAAVAVVLLIVLFVGDYFLNDAPLEPQVTTQNEQNIYNTDDDLSTAIEEELIADNSSNKTVSTHKSDIVRSKISSTNKSSDIKKEDDAILRVEEEKDIKKETENSEDVQKESNKEEKMEGKSSDSDSKNKIYRSGYDFDSNPNYPIIKKNNQPAKWETSVYASNVPSASTNKYDGYGSLASGQVPLGPDEGCPNLEEGSYGDILVQNRYREVYTDIKHRQPITMGISVNHNLDEHWSVTSGLTYTILSSQLRSGSTDYYYSSEQVLHNIGIPLSVNYNIWRNKKMSIYLSGGALVEKNVSGRLTTDYIVDHKFETTKKEDISIDQLQWSLNTSMGIQYNLSKNTGLYIEPGVSYYFKNGSEIETIYKEKPINLSLRFGLRFSLGE